MCNGNGACFASPFCLFGRPILNLVLLERAVLPDRLIHSALAIMRFFSFSKSAMYCFEFLTVPLDNIAA